MDFPLAMHKNAEKASESGEQGRFWEMHDKMFENFRALGAEDLPKYAEKIGLDMNKFKECLDGGNKADDIRKRMAEGRKAGITGPPLSSRVF
jgi:protein-disulfide isomerase